MGGAAHIHDTNALYKYRIPCARTKTKQFSIKCSSAMAET